MGADNGVADLGGTDNQVVNVVAACISRRFKVRATLEYHHTTAAVDVEFGRVGPATDAVRQNPACIRGDHCCIDRTKAVFGKADAAGAGECRGNLGHIADCDCHAVGRHKGAAAFSGLYDEVIYIVAARVGARFKVGAADENHHTAAAVDAEFGGIGPAADAVRHGPAPIGHGQRGIDRAGAVFGIGGTAAAGEGCRTLGHIADRDRHAAGRHKGIACLGGPDDQFVNIVAAQIGGGFKVGAADKADDPAAVDAEFGGIWTAADAECDAAPRHIGGSRCGIDRTRAVFGISDREAAGECWGHIADIVDRDCHAAGGRVGVTAFVGLYDDFVNVVAASIGRRFKIWAALEYHHTTAAVDVEFGRVSPAADAVADAAPQHIGGGLRGIDRTKAVFGIGGTDAAGEGCRTLGHIADCDCHAAGAHKGVVHFGGLYDDVVNVVAAGIGRRFKIWTADKAHHTAAAVDAELGRVVPAADAVADAAPRQVGRGHCGINRSRAVFDKAGTAAAAECRSRLGHIADCDRHAAGRHKCAARLGGPDGEIVNIVAARINGGLEIGAADKADYTTAVVDAEPSPI